MRSTLACLLSIACAGPAPAQLEVRDLVAQHDRGGLPRKSLDVVAGDHLFLRYVIAGVQADKDGKVDVETVLNVLDEAGVVRVNETSNTRDVLALGGGLLPAMTNVNFGLATPPGEYRTEVKITDRISGASASFERKIRCLKPAFAIVRPTFSLDKQGLVPATFRFSLGQRVFYRFEVVGYERGKDRIHVAMTLDTLDEEGNKLMPQPLRAEAKSDDAAQVAKAASVTFTGFLGLNRPGTYRFEIVVTDRQSDQRASFEAPFIVTK